MINWLLENFDFIEVWGRCFLEKYPNVKNKLKRTSKIKISNSKNELNTEKWNKYKNEIRKVVGNDNIILIHSSVDGLSEIGVSAEILLEFLLSLTEQGNTIVLPTYPLTNLKKQGEKVLTYNVNKTICWTGMLPNKFLKVPGVIRSRFPYNTLAAYGPQAHQIMEKNENATYVYGEKSSWKYCVDHHAKILFLGVTSLASNTIAAHMIPDVMGEKWPIDEWYIRSQYKVIDEDKTIEMEIKVQDAERWAKYSTQHALERELKKNNLVKYKHVEDCIFEYVEDSKKMVEHLLKCSQKGKLMFRIPKKYFK